METKTYHTIKDLGIENDTEPLERGIQVHGSIGEFEIRLNREGVPITYFESPKNLLIKKGFCRTVLKKGIDILIVFTEKINQTQGTGRKELLKILKTMDR